MPADISHQAAKAAVQVFHNPCKATPARFSSAILASYMRRVTQTRQVQRHTQAGGILYGFGFVFYQSEGVDATLLDVMSCLRVSFFSENVLFTAGQKKNSSIDVLNFFFFQGPTPSGEHPDPMPMRGNALKRLFSWKLCFDSQFEVTASCRRTRWNQV